ncbi:MAG: 2-oxoisovalerate dehydrogenase [Saprospiraceae bacterium]|nr:2-oxoisovalerate dehydrogenase [Saprospiraceae bacterium]
MQEVIFVINESAEGGFEAEALGLSIFTEAETWTELKENIREAVSCHFDDNVKRIVRMHLLCSTHKCNTYL